MAIETPIVTGYYRTEVLPACDRDPLKGVLAHDALVHPENPLHPGEQGIKMYIGTFHDGQGRLLFSSAQVDYIRYWLHAMKLTTDIIPLPYSECLLTQSEFSNVTSVTYMDGGALRVAVKNIEKNNKRLMKGSNPRLMARRDVFERVRKFWATKTGTWCSLDFESWEKDHEVLTEFGYSSVGWNDGMEVEDCGHCTIKEHRMYTNGVYVPENRNRYQFGDSEEISTTQLKTRITELLSGMRLNGPVYLVFHNPSQDLKDLERLKVPMHGAVQELPEATPSEGVFIIDTAVLFGALEGEGNNTRKLEQICNHLQISTDYLHNAGNDAVYTLRALREMASGEPLDTQRELRWPKRTGDGNLAGVKVNFEAYEEDSDFSDQEGVMSGYNPATGILNE
ncbi:hypothetical protein B0H17DRAFT_1090798 [Mycena rosella]|uniref:Gfd2/YDR514C-like C-terminal domain-containing protein n=1 Tax=Mycena rosella TaxID=1033263 RepID=A0AAD7G415_MYCRO|nr:hypothetical protein B0H17DRAFT_1090798 [Mycena rosella]